MISPSFLAPFLEANPNPIREKKKWHYPKLQIISTLSVHSRIYIIVKSNKIIRHANRQFDMTVNQEKSINRGTDEDRID